MLSFLSSEETLQKVGKNEKEKNRAAAKAFGGPINWYVGIGWATRTRWRRISAEKAFHASTGFPDLIRLWALLKSRVKGSTDSEKGINKRDK